jgi:hypothetical protein
MVTKYKIFANVKVFQLESFKPITPNDKNSFDFPNQEVLYVSLLPYDFALKGTHAFSST